MIEDFCWNWPEDCERNSEISPWGSGVVSSVRRENIGKVRLQSRISRFKKDYERKDEGKKEKSMQVRWKQKNIRFGLWENEKSIGKGIFPLIKNKIHQNDIRKPQGLEGILQRITIGNRDNSPKRVESVSPSRLIKRKQFYF